MADETTRNHSTQRDREADTKSIPGRIPLRAHLEGKHWQCPDRPFKTSFPLLFKKMKTYLPYSFSAYTTSASWGRGLFSCFSKEADPSSRARSWIPWSCWQGWALLQWGYIYNPPLKNKNNNNKTTTTYKCSYLHYQLQSILSLTPLLHPWLLERRCYLVLLV